MLWNANINENVLIILDRMPSKSEAFGFVKEQRSYYSKPYQEDMVNIKQIIYLEDIPKEWSGTQICFGTNPCDYNATQYIKYHKDVEEKKKFLEARDTYLRLKDRFEP